VNEIREHDCRRRQGGDGRFMRSGGGGGRTRVHGSLIGAPARFACMPRLEGAPC
jgi:hypothetical protein